MRRKNKNAPKPLQWRLECLGHSLIEGLAACLPGPWAFRLGEALGGIVWHFMPMRRRIILRNLRIAFAGEKDLPALRQMARDSFCRTAANMISAARTARLAPGKLDEVIHIQNLDLLADAWSGGRGVVLLLSHMGNWEILSRICRYFPAGSKAGAFYRPLNNELMDARVLARRQADGTRMFSKGDSFHSVSAYLREGGIVGILADQRVGMQGELVEFFGRLTRASPLPGLLARRSKSAVLSLAVTTEAPGRWSVVFTPVATPHNTEHCMAALEQSMKSGPVDVFWFQERWKVYLKGRRRLSEWFGGDDMIGEKPHRALLWLCGVASDWQVPADWKHPDVIYEAALEDGPALPSWLPDNTVIHRITNASDRSALENIIAVIDAASALPLDFILTSGAPKPLVKAARREAVPVVSLP